MQNERRYNGRKIVANMLWALLGIATVVLLGAAISLKHSKHCKGINIIISGAEKNLFIDKKEIGDIIESACGGGLQGKSLGSFNLSGIENTLRKNQWIKTAELFFDNNEVLRVEVTEREPVARIFTTAGTSFYLDSSLTSLPLSDKSTARVPVFTHFPSHENAITKADSNLLNDIKNISTYILNDPFWMAQIDQIDITREGTFEMIPKVGNQIIVFGNADNYTEKFNNLLTFYKQVATKVGWNTYSKINVQYKGQIVAVKRGTEDVVQDLLRAKQIMENIAANAQRQASDSIKNIQLEQQQDDNIIPAVPHSEDIPDEQPLQVTPKPVVTMPVTTNPSSTEKPTATLPKTQAAVKTKIEVKKNAKPIEKPFWLQAATTKARTNVVNKSTAKSKSVSPKKPNTTFSKKAIVLKSATKEKTKPIIKPAKTIMKINTKSKAVKPVNNDY